MKSEKGLTLIEVLASVTILSILMGAGFMLFTSVNSLYNNSAQKQSGDSKVSFTLNTISKELAAPVETYLASVNELRFKTLEGNYQALVYNSSGKSAFFPADF